MLVVLMTNDHLLQKLPGYVASWWHAMGVALYGMKAIKNVILTGARVSTFQVSKLRQKYPFYL